MKILGVLALFGVLSIGNGATDEGSTFMRPAIAAAHGKLSPWKVESSVKIPAATLTQAYNEARSAYDRVLSPYAKITPAQAHKIAQDSQPGWTVKDVGLQTIRENLVYMAVLTKGTTSQLTIIDAGNGKILSTRTATRHRMREHDHSNLTF